MNEDNTENKLLKQVLDNLQAEQKRSRRWRIFFRFVYVALIIGVFSFNWSSQHKTEPMVEHTALIKIKGVITSEEEQGVTAENTIKSLQKAFSKPLAKAVILAINSPGGSPVQAGYVYDEILRLRAKHPEKKVYAVIEDLGASGGYYIAAAADEIYADKASLVGSIGVVSGGFGFVGLLEKLGIERRLYTAGKHKGFLDPFQAENKEATVAWSRVLKITHRQFIEQVKKGRGKRLKPNKDLFTGLIWNGEQALKLGLIDGLANASEVARKQVGHAKIVDYSQDLDFWQKALTSISTTFARTLVTELQVAKPEIKY